MPVRGPLARVTCGVPPPRPLRIILNGKVADHTDFRAAVGEMRQAGHPLEVRVTWEPGDAARMAAEAAAAGVETIIAAGGDGTLNEVVRGLVGAGASAQELPTLGICPLGTANDFAVAAGIPLDPLAALRLVATLPARPIDVGRVGDRFFLNVATGGFGAEITAETPEELKSILGGAAYLATGLTRFGSVEPLPVRVEGPGFAWEGRLLVLGIGNGRQSGGGHQLCPHAVLDDGLLEVSLIPELPFSELGEILGAFLTRGKEALGEVGIHARLPWVEVSSGRELAVNLDGEPFSGTQFRFEAVPDALRLHLPPSDILCRQTGGGAPVAEAASR